MKPYDILVPTHLAIETTNMCNGKCIFCPHNIMTRSLGVMNMELFRKIINDAKTIGSVEFITHGGMGEPLFDKSIAKRIATEKSKLNCRVQLHTNGSLLDKDNIQKLFEVGLDVLSISLNAFNDHTYKDITGLDYKKTRQNVENAFEMKEKTQADTKIRITMVKTNDMPPEETENFRDYWRAFTPNVAVHPSKNWAYFTKNEIKGRKYPCKWIWYMMSINWDGKVNLCHEDFDARFVIGDLTKETIVGVFNCDKIRTIRRSFYENGKSLPILCNDCSRLKLDKFWWLGVNVNELPNGYKKYSERFHGGTF
ncbi:MAG: radical SAM protein [Bacteroidales bacterium]|nr:radical SAM protein [Bacteroidales bacterium]